MKIKKTTLQNGLTVITGEIRGFETVSIGIFVGSGAINEEKNYGVSHFVEHMAFKGTKARTASDISEQIERVGGVINAYTSTESTVFYAKVLKNDIELGIDIISDIVQNPVFDECEFRKEKGVIIQEIKMYSDTPDSLVFDLAQESAFGDTNLGRNIIGSEESVSNMVREDLFGYIREYYSSDKMVLCVSGACDHDNVVDLANKYCDNMRCFDTTDYPKQMYSGGFSCAKKDIDQANIVFGFESLKRDEDHKHAMTTLSILLGGGMSSRLFRKIREDHGLVYSICAFNSSYRDTGSFGVYAGCDSCNLNQVIDLSLEQLEDVKNNINDDELQRSKTQLKSSLLMGLESTSTRMKMLGNTWLQYGKLVDIEWERKSIDAITIDMVQNIAKEIFKGRMTLAVVSGEDDKSISRIAQYSR